MTTDNSLPVSAKAGFEYNIEKQQFTYNFDFKNFPANTNKIEEIGIVRRHKYLIECNGAGGFNIKEMSSPEDRLKKIKEMKDKGLITETQYKKKQEEILANM